MHPDAIIAGLRRELHRLHPDAEDYADRRKAIEAELERTDGLPRPVATAEEPATAVDPNVAYLAGLKRELQRVAADAREAVKAEIRRVQALLRHGAPQEAHADDDDDGGEDASQEPANGAPDASDEAGDLESKTRDELNAIAVALGIEAPEKLPNKGAVVEAIQHTAAQAPADE